MMQHMTPNTTPVVMMPGMEAYTLFWIAIGVLLCLLVVTCIWLFTRWLKHRGKLPVQYPAQPKDAYQDYQHGYQEQQPFLQTYKEGGRSYAYSQDDQPQAQQLERMPLQH